MLSSGWAVSSSFETTRGSFPNNGVSRCFSPAVPGGARLGPGSSELLPAIQRQALLTDPRSRNLGNLLGDLWNLLGVYEIYGNSPESMKSMGETAGIYEIYGWNLLGVYALGLSELLSAKNAPRTGNCDPLRKCIFSWRYPNHPNFEWGNR